MYVSPHGKAAGLSDRLLGFAEALSTNRTYPWVGTGLIDDLRAAAALVDKRPVPPTMAEQMETENQEYDL